MDNKKVLTKYEIVKKLEDIRNFAKYMGYKVEEKNYDKDYFHPCHSIELIGIDDDGPYTVHTWIFDLLTLKEI